jgi:hypothetical protein
MSAEKSQYISASRRTDLPRFHTQGFFSAWRAGFITYVGPYGGSFTVSLKKEGVAGYVFWSKDYSDFIAHPDFPELIKTNNAVFHYTINDCPRLEPRLASLESRIETLHRLAELAGPQRIIWRYDPFCKFIAPDGKTMTNEEGFYRVLPLVVRAGVTQCVFSFMSLYGKTQKRPVEFLAFGEQEKIALCRSIADAAAEYKVSLANCCNREVLAYGMPISQAHCVDDELLRETDRFGVHKKLTSKPTREACGCFESRDIGSYSPACGHGCLYCYANPKIPAVRSSGCTPASDPSASHA